MGCLYRLMARSCETSESRAKHGVRARDAVPPADRILNWANGFDPAARPLGTPTAALAVRPSAWHFDLRDDNRDDSGPQGGFRSTDGSGGGSRRQEADATRQDTRARGHRHPWRGRPGAIPADL